MPSVAEKLRSNLCSLLLPFHALLSCDSTRAKVRKKAVQILKNQTETCIWIWSYKESICIWMTEFLIVVLQETCFILLFTIHIIIIIFFTY